MLSLIVAEGIRSYVLARCFGFSPKQRPNSYERYAAPIRDETGYARGSGVGGKAGLGFRTKARGPSIDQSSMQQWR